MENAPRWIQDRLVSAMRKVISIRQDLRYATLYKDQRRLERELKQAQIECGYAQHWVLLT
jgi:hypothetical protein